MSLFSRKKSQTVDMTQGSITPKMIRFALPVLLGMLFQKVYNFADVYIVGHYLGDEALAAVSIAGSSMYLLMSIMIGLTTGVSIVISQYYGAGDHNKVTQAFGSSITVAIGSTLVITGLGLIFGKPLLRIMQTSDELMPQAWTYLIVIFAGSFSTMLYNWIAAVLRSLGNSVLPLIALIISSVLNIILDILFIAWIPMGVAGAALATVLAQVISGAMCLIYAMKVMPLLRLTRETLKPKKEYCMQILKFGIPTGLQMSIISISDMTLQAMINTYETALIVAYSVAFRIEGIGWLIAEAVGSALGTFAGQNVGARKFDRVKQGVNRAYLMETVCYAVFFPIVFFCGEPIMRAFTDNPDSIRYGMEYMRIFSGFFFVGGFMVIYHNILRSSGDVTVTVLMGVSEIITRMGFTFLFSHWFGYYGLWWVSPITWVCATAVGAVRYYSGKWQQKALTLEKEA